MDGANVEGSQGEHNLARQGERQANHELTATLLTDFRKSYEFSQGNNGLQRTLMTLLRDQYTQLPNP
jgi:hypothetical protein